MPLYTFSVFSICDRINVDFCLPSQMLSQVTALERRPSTESWMVCWEPACWAAATRRPCLTLPDPFPQTSAAFRAVRSCEGAPTPVFAKKESFSFSFLIKKGTVLCFQLSHGWRRLHLHPHHLQQCGDRGERRLQHQQQRTRQQQGRKAHGSQPSEMTAQLQKLWMF